MLSPSISHKRALLLKYIDARRRNQNGAVAYSVSLHNYEEASGLVRGQLWKVLTDSEKARLFELGYRYRNKLSNPALDYLLEIFPLPELNMELVPLMEYERRCGFSRYQLLSLLTQEQKEKLTQMGHRKKHRLPYRAIIYLKSLGFY